jgi:hypothetical protein
LADDRDTASLFKDEDMPDIMFRLTDLELFCWVTGTLVGIAIVSTVLVQWFIPMETRYKDNAVTGTVSSLIALIYGVLAGLTALYLINNLTYTSDAVQREANSIANIYRDSSWLKDPTRTEIQNDLAKYLHNVIDVEWPHMKLGDVLDQTGENIIKHISLQLSQYQTQPHDELIMRDLLDEIKSLYDARETRIEMSFSGLNGEVWVVIGLGTLLLMSINLLFGMNVYFHLFTAIALAIMSAAMIFLLVTLDKPFQGEFVIDSDAFQTILVNLDKQVPDPVKKVSMR